MHQTSSKYSYIYYIYTVTLVYNCVGAPLKHQNAYKISYKNHK